MQANNKNRQADLFYATKSSKLKSIIKGLYFDLRGVCLSTVFRPKKIDSIRPEEVDSIVIIRIDRIGDTVVSLPAIKALKEAFPASRLAVMVRPGNTAILRKFPWIDECIPYSGFFNAISVLRRRNFYLAIDFLVDYPLKTALICFFSKARIKAGFDIAGRGSLFNLALRPTVNEQPLSRHTLELAKAIAGLARIPFNMPFDSAPLLMLSQEDRDFAAGLLRIGAVQAQGLIVGLHPGGNFPSQRWPLERFAAVADELILKDKAEVVIFGSANEQAMLNKLISLMQNKPVLAVGLPLDRLASVIACVNILICNNSGLMHIAAALGIPTVSTMGPTHPQLWMPRGDNHIVLRKELACAPCSRPVCLRHDCMKLITIEEVLSAVRKQIGRGRKS